MKFLSVVAGVFVLSAGVAAQGPPAKGSGKSAIALTLPSLGCSTALGTDTMAVLSWSWGASNPADLISGGGGSGKVNVQDLNIMKAFDACSPALFGAVATGKAFAGPLTLVASNKDGSTTTLTLSDVRVSSWQASGSPSTDAAVESASFAFSKVCLADGASGARFCYDLKLAKTF
jgi:type VI protein secretion system component Hcp